MNFSPKLIFYTTFLATIGTGIAGGAVHLSSLIPIDLVVPVTGWISLATFCAMSFLTLATGYSGIGKGPLAAPPTVSDADAIKVQAVKAAIQRGNS